MGAAPASQCGRPDMSSDMTPRDPREFFGEKHAASYDQKFARLAPMREALHLLTSAVLADLPANARILCVGAGTGAELIYLAQRNPDWRFTAVEPSAPMLNVCRQRIGESGIQSRCELHGGFMDTLPASEPFDAATAVLVSQFLLMPQDRIRFFRSIAERLQPGGYLVSADLAFDMTSEACESLLEVWFRLMRMSDPPPDSIESMRAPYGRDVAVLPADQVSSIIEAGGFELPIQFLQTGLIHAWYSRLAARPEDTAP